ncbi:MAG TPA: DUF5615 family PIN-like protein [Sphingomonas sp.]|jgi:hypothetical protein|uniref:DUF5615 family PIN-like protein n=1 Tax=Sphingomonas sp. TaxID=28214 RepID=UPI002ED96212
MLRFLIDECLSPAIALKAISLEIEATHLNWFNQAGYRDQSLIPLVLQGDYIFVTNNGVDFRPIYRSMDIHPALIVILPSVPKVKQVDLFLVVLDCLQREPDTINKLIEIDADGVITIADFPPFRDNL